MFGRQRNKTRKQVVHSPECEAIHQAMLMSLYLGYGAPSAPLFIPTGSLVCTCADEHRGGTTTVSSPAEPTNQPMQRVLVIA